MSQSRKGSAIEAIVNIMIGLIVSYVANHLVFPHYGFTPSPRQNVEITAIFTVISFVRSYSVRRLFNHYRQMQS